MGVVTKIYDSNVQMSDVIYLNLYNHHLSYITNFDKYAPKFECSKCYKFFSREWNLKRHMGNCFERTKLTFPGGFLQN